MKSIKRRRTVKKFKLPHARSEDCLQNAKEWSPKWALRRTNSVDNAHRALISDMVLTDGDSDFDVEQNYDAWSIKHDRIKDSYDDIDIKRQDIISEFIHTERSYLRDLLLLQKAFKAPLQRNNIIDDHLLNRIFINLDEIIVLHKTFKKKLVSLQDNPNEYVDSIGDVICDFLKNPLFLSNIVLYCSNLSDSLMVLKERMRVPDFAAFLIDCETNVLCRRKRLKELLPRPMQRVTRYPLLLQELVKRSSSKNQDHDMLVESLEVIKAVCKKIDDDVAKKESSRIESAARARLQADNVNKEIGDLILNLPVIYSHDDKKDDVNIVLFERYIVLFPNDKSLYSSSSTSDQTLETVVMTVRDGIFISHDKQDSHSKSLYIISTSETLICHVCCRNTEEYKLLSEALSKLQISREGDKPPVKLLDLADIMESPTTLGAASHYFPEGPTSDEQDTPAELSPTTGNVCTSQHLHHYQHLHPEDKASEAIKKRLLKADEEIFSLLTTKLRIMQEYYGRDHIPIGFRDISQSFAQLSSDANTLHQVALDLMKQYKNPDKDEKLLKIRSSYSSMVANISCISKFVLRPSDYDEAAVASVEEDGTLDAARDGWVSKLRRASMILGWKSSSSSRAQDHVEMDGGVLRRPRNKGNVKRGSAALPLSKPGSTRTSPKSSTESLNRVNCNRLSSSSHHSTDSEHDSTTNQIDNKTNKVRPVTKTNSGKSHRSSTFFSRRSQIMGSDNVRPIITPPVLKHTTNKMLIQSNAENS